MTNTSENSRLNQRLSHLEAEVAGIGTKVSGLENGFERLVVSVDALAQKVGEGRQTNWGTLISAIGLVVLLGGLCLAPIYAQLTNFTESQRRQWTVIRDHMAEEGHKPMQIRVNALEDGLKNLDVVLQREMRLLNATLRAEIEGTDSILQREMDLKDEKQLVRLEALDEKVERIESEQQKRTSHVYVGRGTPK